VLNWANRFSTFCFLDNHLYSSPQHSFECLVAAGEISSISANAGNALEGLQDFISTGSAWLFGHLGYDLKYETEGLASHQPDHVCFPDLFFFRPKHVFRFDNTRLIVESTTSDPQELLSEILISTVPTTGPIRPFSLSNRIQKEDYISIVRQLQGHILRGDCYEINFCQEFFAEDMGIDPIATYQQLSKQSPNPFSACYKVQDRFLFCASPERFLKKTGARLLSQPIKGTSKRMQNQNDDAESKRNLVESAKERAENVMVVDLVRNDLSKICVAGTVQVDELFGTYTFPQVHQLISTVSGELPPDVAFRDIIRSTFPMGSMTGAPKRRVLELIEKYERTKRGIFSGALGYIEPGGDFDFNVVIRSIMYNALDHYVSIQTGSAITFQSRAEDEWEECMLKAKVMRAILEEA
jgi:para-aminobenzoate synthetase component I